MNTKNEKAKKGICFITMNMSENCNLNCTYCFVRKSNPLNEARHMDRRTALAAVDFLAGASGDHDCCQIRFFGGEPLLNFDTIRETLSYARGVFGRLGKTVVFSLATNGTIMRDEVKRFLKDEDVKVSISIDGDGVAHDINRKLPNSEGSFRLIEPHLGDFLEIDPNALIVTTMTSSNTGIYRTFEFLHARGYRNFRTELVSTIDRGIRVGEEEIVRLTGNYDALADYYTGLLKAGDRVNINDFTKFIWRMIAEETVQYYCGAGKYYVNISSDGRLYVCHRFISNGDFIVGNVFDGITNEARMESVVPSVDDKPRCRECGIKDLCGGGCAYDTYIMFRDFFVTEEIRCRLMECQINNARKILHDLGDRRGEALQGAYDIFRRSYLSTERKGEDISGRIAGIALPEKFEPLRVKK